MHCFSVMAIWTQTFFKSFNSIHRHLAFLITGQPSPALLSSPLPPFKIPTLFSTHLDQSLSYICSAWRCLAWPAGLLSVRALRLLVWHHCTTIQSKAHQRAAKHKQKKESATRQVWAEARASLCSWETRCKVDCWCTSVLQESKTQKMFCNVHCVSLGPGITRADSTKTEVRFRPQLLACRVCTTPPTGSLLR